LGSGSWRQENKKKIEIKHAEEKSKGMKGGRWRGGEAEERSIAT